MITDGTSIPQNTDSNTVFALFENKRRRLSTIKTTTFKNPIIVNTNSGDYKDLNLWNLADDSALMSDDLLVTILDDYFRNINVEETDHGTVRDSSLLTPTIYADGNVISVSTSRTQSNRHAASMKIAIRKLIHEATDCESIITILELAEFESIATRLKHLKKVTDEDTEDLPINIDSLKMSALFITENPQMPMPQITINYDGMTYLRWKLKDDSGVLGMEFSPSLLIRFTAILHASDFHPNRWSISGFTPQKDMMNAIKPFIKKLVQV